MAQADALPFDYENYGNEVRRHLESAERRAQELGWRLQPDFSASLTAATHLAEAGRAVHQAGESASGAQLQRINAALLAAERAMLGEGLPHRPWFRHTIYAPGEYTGYAAVVIPGVNESMDRNDLAGAVESLGAVTRALERAASVLQSAL
jgi:N-acetylated-alpha-linked acidic dipeptidase